MAKFINNSSPSGEIYDARIEYVGDGTEAEGTLWLPTTQAEIETRYIRDGTIFLGALDAKGSVRANTFWIPPTTTPWFLNGVYLVVLGLTYKKYELQYNANSTASVWYGDQDTALTLLPIDDNLIYSPPQVPYKFYEDPVLPRIPTVSFSTIADITDTSPHEVTITFNTILLDGFSMSNITYDTNNGLITNLVQTSDPLIWTFNYTAIAGRNDATNIITIDTNYWDIFGNKCITSISSNNFAVGTIIIDELVVDPTCDSPTDWSHSHPSYSSVTGGKVVIANISSVSIRVYPDLTESLVVGGTYRVGCTTDSANEILFRFYVGNNTVSGLWFSGTGVRYADILYLGDVDNVSVQYLAGYEGVSDNWTCTRIS